MCWGGVLAGAGGREEQGAGASQLLVDNPQNGRDQGLASRAAAAAATLVEDTFTKLHATARICRAGGTPHTMACGVAATALLLAGCFEFT
jgi:hypothetical protein